jgi:endonuclease/exonuclease/phosphatase family metal-dependent hydrolase
MNATAGPLLHYETGHCGNALLSRPSVKTFWLHDLSRPSREPRGAIEAMVEVERIDFRVVVTHFGLFGRDRVAQAQTLKRAVLASEPLPTILLGDFNEWVPRARTLLYLDSWLGPSAGARTFPSWLPLLAIDRIWVEGPHRVERVWAHRTKLSAAASDHLPLVASVRLFAH